MDLEGKGLGLVRYGERNTALASVLRDRGAGVQDLCLYEWRLPEDLAPLETLVAGIVGAGGNAGAVAAGFLFRIESLSSEGALLVLGVGVAAVSGLTFEVRFSPQTEMEEKRALANTLVGKELAHGSAAAGD